MNVQDLLQEGRRRLRAADSLSPEIDAEVLLCHCLGTTRIGLYTGGDRTVSKEEISGYYEALERRMRAEPVAYIRGRKEFWSLALTVTPDVLIPRPDTETVVEEALERIGDGSFREGLIADVGTGSGAIAIALASELPGATVLALDRDEKALRLARQNAFDNRCGERLWFACADMLGPLKKKCALIVSNPPYIDERTYAALPSGVRDYEPRGALLAGPLGTEYHRRLIEDAPDLLEEGGWLIMEIGDGQRDEVEGLFMDSGNFDSLSFRKDLAGRDRVVAGRKGTGCSSG